MRIILKLLAIPVLLLLVLAGCGIYCIVNAQWMNLAILAGMAVAAFAATFLLVWAEFTAESISAKLSEFIRA